MGVRGIVFLHVFHTCSACRTGKLSSCVCVCVYWTGVLLMQFLLLLIFSFCLRSFVLERSPQEVQVLFSCWGCAVLCVAFFF